jgi:hypothetical protein
LLDKIINNKGNMIGIIDFAEAIRSLTPNVSFTWRADSIEEWDLDNSGTTKPTKAEIDAEVIRLQAEYDAQEYARNRATAFPSIGDQLDMQYHDQLDGTTTWKDAVAKVKSDNPKA